MVQQLVQFSTLCLLTDGTYFAQGVLPLFYYSEGVVQVQLLKMKSTVGWLVLQRMPQTKEGSRF